MAIPLDANHLFCTGAGKSTSRLEQVLHDHGLFLGWHHDVSTPSGKGFKADQVSYLVFASVFITVKSIQKQVSEKRFTISELFKNKLFFTLIVSLMSTYVLWFLVSFLFFDPWHMFTSVSGSYSYGILGFSSLRGSSSNTFSLRPLT